MGKIESYPKDSIRQYHNGWYITFKALNGNRIQAIGPYITKAIAENDREILNDKHSKIHGTII